MTVMQLLRGPRAEVEGVGRLVPVAALRLGALGCGLLTELAVVLGRPGEWFALGVVVLALLAAVAPESPAPGIFAVGVVLLQLSVGELDARALAAALGLHATLVLCAISAGLPLRGRCEVAVLLPSLQRWAVVAGGTCALALLLAAARGAGLRVGEYLLLLVAAVVIAGAGLLGLSLARGLRR